nr:tautomerase family protein [Kineococcus siccus]
MVTIDVHEDLADRRAALSAAIHRGLVRSLQMPTEDLFQVFRLHPRGDLVYSRTYPDAERTDLVLVQVLLAPLYDAAQKQAMGRAVVEELAAVGVKPDDVLIACTENGDGDWYAPTRADAVAAGFGAAPAVGR